ncbi:hypothetical protein DEA8626_04048 [Defluviimonas aquaemixtae]|uniref:Copper-binding protein n=1 Tax=Albidovulum aquaemixtae TaxID=1542388 RepID=A0A2R8BNK1_9RHOB|nr:hypothetical protein [Defluviimonas aquaemixtae]SPH25013.1 hypothetical protein DEA8626_04048 [Defluviimonas aquaemixtae]
MKIMTTTPAALVLASSLAFAEPAVAAGTHGGGHGSGQATAIGVPGNPAEVDRDIRMDLGEMSFSPDAIGVKADETIRFIVTNSGDFLHEFNIATAKMHEQHTEEMMILMESGAIDAERINHEMITMTENGA